MEQKICEIVVHGSHSAGMAKFLSDHGALLLRIESPCDYVFVNDNIFENALVKLQIALRQGFYFVDEEVKSE